MRTRQAGIEAKMIALAAQITALLTPGIPVSDKAAEIAKLNAEATAKTYDSSTDPFILATNLGSQWVGIEPQASYTFNHNMGYVPIVQIVMEPGSGDGRITVIGLTDTTAVLFNSSGTTRYLKIYAH